MPAAPRDSDRRRIRTTLGTIIAVAMALAAAEAAIVLSRPTSGPGLALLAAFTAAFALFLFWPYRLAAPGRDRLERAVFLSCAAILGIQLVYLVLYPRAFPAISIASFVIVALALSFVSGRPLFQLVVAAWILSAAAILWGTMGHPLLSIPAFADAPIIVVSGLAAVTVGMVLLWQFARQMTQSLTQSRKAHTELSAAHDKLRDVDRFKSQFINTAAHELNTPMTPVMLQLGLLKMGMGEQSTPAQAKSLQVLERNLDRMNRLVREMLDVARIQAGKLGLHCEPVRLQEVLRETVEDYAAVAAQRGLTLVRDGILDLEVMADRQRLGQVVSNLLSNAVRLTPQGGTITVRTSMESATAQVAVADTGVGLTPEQRDSLFQPFTRVHDQTTGTGLGLFICRGLVEGMGGQLWAESPGPSQGATFAFRLPLAPPAPMA